MLGFSISKEEMKVFMEELEEQIQSLETHIIEMEKRADPVQIKEIFRIAHTIKGSAASIGHDSMARLTHAMESVLDAVRQGKMEISPEIINALFPSLDLLKRFKSNLESGKMEEVDITVVHERLERLARKEGPQRQVSSSSAVSLKEGESLYQIEVRFAADCDLPAVRAFQALLEAEKLGRIAQSSPTADELKSGASEFSELLISLSSGLNEEAIRTPLQSVTEVSDVKVNKISEGKSSGAASRAEGEISQELKMSRTIRVDVEVFDTLLNLAGELVIDKTRLISLGGDLQEKGESGFLGGAILEATQHLDKITTELQEQIMKARLVPIDLIFKKFPRMMRDLATRSGKLIEFKMNGADTQLDRSVIEEIIDPLIHLLRNSLDHGIETPEVRQRAGKRPKGLIELSAYHKENHVIIQVEDDGRGIDLERIKARAVEHNFVTKEELSAMSRSEIIDLIFLPGFSTAEKVTDVSGRGVGMDIVKASLQKIGGSLEIQTNLGKGTLFIIKIPLTLAILQGLMVVAHGTAFAIPLASVRETVRLTPDKMKTMGGKEVFVLRGSVVPIVSLDELYGASLPRGRGIYSVVVVSHGERLVGIHVDDLLRKQEVVIKTMGSYIGDVPGITGATVLGDGTIALILDVSSFINLASQGRHSFRQAS